MLLNDIGCAPTTTLRKINQYLKSNYGFNIVESTSVKDMSTLMETIQDEIVDLKLRGDDAKASPEISKRLLVLEGIKVLREYAITQFQSPKLEPLVKMLTGVVVKEFHHRGTSIADFDDAVNGVMKAYRSSEFDFPNDYIENRVRNAAMAAINGESHQAEMAPMMETTE